MSHHHLQSVMTGEWDSVEISEGEVDSIDQATVITTGLSSEPSLLHAEHLGNLNELIIVVFTLEERLFLKHHASEHTA